MIETGTVNTQDMLAHADPFGMYIGRLPDVETREETDARVEALRQDVESSAWFLNVESDLELVDALAHVTVSPETADICTREIASAKCKGWVTNV